MIQDQIIILVEKLKKKKASRTGYDKYLDYIRLPLFKNLKPLIKIEFEFPVTFLVGQNGSGKSSVLHALYGTTDNTSPAKFWFETALDPIAQSNCFIYAYFNREANRQVEILKTRIKSKKGKTGATEYWEPSRPVIEYGMAPMPPIGTTEKLLGRSKTRWSGMKRKIVYVDFRSELSAFDKCFYFYDSFGNLKSSGVQSYIRGRSYRLHNALKNGKIVHSGKVSQNEKAHILTQDELNTISLILGKKYTEGTIIKHKFYKIWGTSIVFKTEHHTYSDAFAGSGETAVIKLITSILQAEENSLVLLDEPEISLYPGAQDRLKKFLLEQSLKRNLQIIVSTHSPTLIQHMPEVAIKVFHREETTGKFLVEPRKSPQEAFYYLEQPITTKKTLIVEDKMAKEIISAVLNSLGNDIAHQFELTVYPGGSSNIKKSLMTYSINKEKNKWVFLDGDQRQLHFDTKTLTSDQKTVEFLTQKIREQCREEIPIPVDGNKNAGSDSSKKIELQKGFLEFYNEHVSYLPGNTPEELIWDKSYAEGLILNESDKNTLKSKATLKDKLHYMSELGFGSIAFIRKWIQNNTKEYQDLSEKLQKISRIN